jgi:hypothetical protein
LDPACKRLAAFDLEFIHLLLLMTKLWLLMTTRDFEPGC